MIGCNHTSFEWTRAVCHIYGIIRHMQGLYTGGINLSQGARGQRLFWVPPPKMFNQQLAYEHRFYWHFHVAKQTRYYRVEKIF